ncbi:MAG TPA: hypothetical protein VLT59_08705, partial [Steroidobacteraceae bacterium]|nr:hypothetical protein [Steroidobacteraceae bacterium]
MRRPLWGVECRVVCMPYRNAFAFAASLWLLTGCSALETLDELSVGRAERVDAPPFVVEYSLPVPAVQPDLVLIAPVRLDDPRNREDWPPGREAALAPLLAAMNDHLAGRGCCSSAAVAEPPAGGPFLYVGSAEAEDVPAPAAVERLPGAEYPAMVVYYEKPTADWQAWLGDAMRRSGARHAVWLQV